MGKKRKPFFAWRSSSSLQGCKNGLPGVEPVFSLIFSEERVEIHGENVDWRQPQIFLGLMQKSNVSQTEGGGKEERNNLSSWDRVCRDRDCWEGLTNKQIARTEKLS